MHILQHTRTWSINLLSNSMLNKSSRSRQKKITKYFMYLNEQKQMQIINVVKIENHRAMNTKVPDKSRTRHSFDGIMAKWIVISRNFVFYWVLIRWVFAGVSTLENIFLHKRIFLHTRSMFVDFKNKSSFLLCKVAVEKSSVLFVQLLQHFRWVEKSEK